MLMISGILGKEAEVMFLYLYANWELCVHRKFIDS